MSDISRCEDCIHAKMCAWYVDADNCKYFKKTTNVAPTPYEEGYNNGRQDASNEIFNDLISNQIICVSEDGTVFFCIKSKTFKQLKKKYMRSTDEL